MFLCVMMSCFFTNHAASQTPYYYAISYATPDWGCGIKVSKINLETKEVVDFDTAGLCYVLADPRPIVFTRDDSDYIFASTANCGNSKRTPASNECFSDYVIYNDLGKIINRGRLENKYVYSKTGSSGTEIKIKYRLNTDSFRYWMNGAITLNDDNSIKISPIAKCDYSDSAYPIISGFQYFNKIDDRNNTIYWDIGHDANYLLRIDADNKALLDSLKIPDKRTHTCLFALSNDQSKIYTFHFFARYANEYYENGEPPILPSYIKVYRADTLIMIDSFPAPDPSGTAGYFGGDWWPCEAIGDYRVYYYFASDGPESFFPAIVYIFNTRNNESTWLNIGWR